MPSFGTLAALQSPSLLIHGRFFAMMKNFSLAWLAGIVSVGAAMQIEPAAIARIHPRGLLQVNGCPLLIRFDREQRIECKG
jgi:hypothetical protein